MPHVFSFPLAKIAFLLGILLLALLFPNPVHAAGYLKLGDIKGESRAEGHKDWIGLESVTMPARGGVVTMNSATSTTRAASTATGSSEATTAGAASDAAAAQSRRTYEPIKFSKRIDKSSPMLQKAATEGTVFATAILDNPDPKHPGQYIRMELKNLVISSYQASGSDSSGRPMESMNLNFEKITYSTKTAAKKAQ